MLNKTRTRKCNFSITWWASCTLEDRCLRVQRRLTKWTIFFYCKTFTCCLLSIHLPDQVRMKKQCNLRGRNVQSSTYAIILLSWWPFSVKWCSFFLFCNVVQFNQFILLIVFFCSLYSLVISQKWMPSPAQRCSKNQFCSK